MKKYKFLMLLISLPAVQSVWAQEVLPAITVKDFNGKIVVSWQNAYNLPVTNISIQRSFDSTKNFSTVGSVLNPQGIENGFADDKPPYNKMYYRVFISFEGGSYIFGTATRPVKVMPEKKPDLVNVNIDSSGAKKSDSTATNPVASEDNAALQRFPWQANPITDSITRSTLKRDSIISKNHPEIIIYPSLRIYTGRDNNLVVHLHDAPYKKYTVKFYDENDDFLFELTKLKEEYLIIEKVNFVHSGWFHFELFESGKLVEKNKFYIGKDGKTPSNEPNRRGNK